MYSDDEHDNDRPKTRADYRREQEQAEKDFQERDRKRVQVEREYARTHGGSLPADDSGDSEQRVKPVDDRQQRLGRRLNWAIFWLVLLIIVVYLILFFVD
ncbi:hypothetical protein FD13_GL001570 [Levilactobacillus senmaizukei DSM 21775 = NBRC 103853]|uniref:Uncharacterized protein n=1 Tax=Levilactobacillus senmaizukei DSM 21775 = NBRC 103853 TaxID=1423803 RepID=A0A0R2DFR4_9LACO|nr:hypothetical protein [Levilactobacillus senmaizukei]KRN02850.1 hypothetical protein FD13_GL001570 [Levilactobacillus senmaizukei DSM 21775 = NBRC 103853]